MFHICLSLSSLQSNIYHYLPRESSLTNAHMNALEYVDKVILESFIKCMLHDIT